MDQIGVKIPEGFGRFWADLVAEAEDHTLVYDLVDQDEVKSDTHQIQKIEFKGVQGDELHGWLALPNGVERKAPGFLWLPPYSRWSMLPNEYGTRPGYASASLNFFGESSFHQEEYTPARGYFREGVERPETWIFGRLFQNSVVLGRIFATLRGVDRERIGAAGMSQGAGLAIWLGAMWEPTKAVVADMPFLGGMDRVLAQDRPFRYPLKELTDYMQSSDEAREQVFKTVSFYDTVNVAHMCLKPTRLTLGLKDPAVRPQQVKGVFEALAGPKELEELEWGHDWHPRMIEGGTAWFDKYL